MVKVRMFKMPFRTMYFNKNQKVWIQKTTGSLAAKVVGKFRGKNRYISAWVNWDKKNREKYLLPKVQGIEIDSNFAKKHNIKIW